MAKRERSTRASTGGPKEPSETAPPEAAAKATKTSKATSVPKAPSKAKKAPRAAPKASPKVPPRPAEANAAEPRGGGASPARPARGAPRATVTRAAEKTIKKTVEKTLAAAKTVIQKAVAAKSARPPAPRASTPPPKARATNPALAAESKPPPAPASPASPPSKPGVGAASGSVDPRTLGPVLWVASEAVPLASTGGLGDVVGALPAVLRSLGWDVRVCLPYYRQQIKQAVSPPLSQFDLNLAEPLRVIVRALEDPPGGVPTYLIDCPPLFDRGGLYVDASGAFVDNPYRFGAFQLAVMELAASLDPVPSILHSHDWHASLLPALVRLPGTTAKKLHQVRTIFTIHNLQYQGDTERGIIDVLNLPPETWSPDWAEHFGRFIPMKAAIMTADRVTTVSPTYAEELRGPVRGQGLDGIIRSRGGDMRGLINGIDDVSWNPASDRALKANFSALELEGREACKRAMRAELGLPERPDRPLIGFIGRMVTDKGVDLIMDALPQLLALDAQVVILGSGERELENRLRGLEAAYVDRGFRALIKFDLSLSRRLYGSFDILLVPSRLEPCGLVQLYALRYGAVPIVHGVGGLRDTVKEGENGFVFHEPTAQALADAVGRAVALWDDPEGWKALQQRGMKQDFSWRNAALPYDALYREVLSTPVRRAPVAPPPSKPAPAPPPPPVKVEAQSFRLMVQGPRALFAYWDLAQEGPLELVVEERPSGVIFTAAAELPNKGERWMGALPDQAYRAFLRGKGGRVIALSNAVVTPLEAPPPPESPQPAWLESAVDVGVFEKDNEGRRWASVFPEAPSFAPSPEGGLEPHWHAPPPPAPPPAEPTPATPLPPPERHAGARNASPAITPEVQAAPPNRPFAGAAQPPLPAVPAPTPHVGRASWVHVPPRALEPRALRYVRTHAHSGSLVQPLPLPPTAPPGPRALDLRDVYYAPGGGPGSDGASRAGEAGSHGMPSSGSLARNRSPK